MPVRTAITKSLQITILERVWRKGNPPNIVSGNINWSSNYEEEYGGSLKNQKQSYYMTQQSHYWPYIWKRRKLIQNDTFTSVFIGALFTIAKTWKKPKCPLTNDNRQKRCGTHVYIHIYVYICVYTHTERNTETHNGILFSHEKEWNNATCSKVVGPKEYHIKRSKS